jgi:hypothetical protein
MENMIYKKILKNVEYLWGKKSNFQLVFFWDFHLDVRIMLVFFNKNLWMFNFIFYFLYWNSFIVLKLKNEFKTLMDFFFWNFLNWNLYQNLYIKEGCWFITLRSPKPWWPYHALGTLGKGVMSVRTWGCFLC